MGEGDERELTHYDHDHAEHADELVALVVAREDHVGFHERLDVPRAVVERLAKERLAIVIWRQGRVIFVRFVIGYFVGILCFPTFMIIWVVPVSTK